LITNPEQEILEIEAQIKAIKDCWYHFPWDGLAAAGLSSEEMVFINNRLWKVWKEEKDKILRRYNERIERRQKYLSGKSSAVS